METALMFGAWVLFLGAGSGLVWWRLAPAQANGGDDRPAVGFDGPPPRWTPPLPPRPDEIQWIDDHDEPTGWRRAARGVALVVLVLAAGTVLAIGLYTAGKFLVQELVSYFGTGLGS
jgi:hypothetical protein